MTRYGELQLKKVPHGTQQKVWIVMADEALDATGRLSDSSLVELYDLSMGLSDDVWDVPAVTEPALSCFGMGSGSWGRCD